MVAAWSTGRVVPGGVGGTILSSAVIPEAATDWREVIIRMLSRAGRSRCSGFVVLNDDAARIVTILNDTVFYIIAFTPVPSHQYVVRVL